MININELRQNTQASSSGTNHPISNQRPANDPVTDKLVTVKQVGGVSPHTLSETHSEDNSGKSILGKRPADDSVTDKLVTVQQVVGEVSPHTQNKIIKNEDNSSENIAADQFEYQNIQLDGYDSPLTFNIIYKGLSNTDRIAQELYKQKLVNILFPENDRLTFKQDPIDFTSYEFVFSDKDIDISKHVLEFTDRSDDKNVDSRILTKAEKIAVRSWTAIDEVIGGTYSDGMVDITKKNIEPCNLDLNKKLHTAEPLDTYERNMVRFLDSSLEKIPSQPGDFIRVDEYSSLSTPWDNKIKVGDIVTNYPCFMSVSASAEYIQQQILLREDTKVNVYLYFQNSHSSKPLLKGAASLNDELESLFKRDSVFRVQQIAIADTPTGENEALDIKKRIAVILEEVNFPIDKQVKNIHTGEVVNIDPKLLSTKVSISSQDKRLDLTRLAEKSFIESLHTIKDLLTEEPATIAEMIRHTNANGEHASSQIAKITVENGIVSFATIWLSILHVLYKQQYLKAKDLITTLLPKKEQDSIASLAHAIVGVGWNSEAGIKLCALLADIASTDVVNLNTIIEHLSLKQLGYGFKQLKLEQLADFYNRAKHADNFNENSHAKTLLKSAQLIPKTRELYQKTSTQKLSELNWEENLSVIQKQFEQTVIADLNKLNTTVTEEKATLEQAKISAKETIDKITAQKQSKENTFDSMLKSFISHNDTQALHHEQSRYKKMINFEIKQAEQSQRQKVPFWEQASGSSSTPLFEMGDKTSGKVKSDNIADQQIQQTLASNQEFRNVDEEINTKLSNLPPIPAEHPTDIDIRERLNNLSSKSEDFSNSERIAIALKRNSNDNI